MFEKMKGILISGMCFGEKPHPLELFPKDSHRVSLIYGKNGSGKSTVANAFKNYSDISETPELTVNLVDYKKSIMLSETSEDEYYGLRENIYVFNEDYIMNNVGFKDDGLETIVLFGKQNKAADDIASIQEKLDITLEKKEELSKLIETSQNKLKGTKKELEKVLKTDWASKDAEIKQNKTNSAVNDSVIKELYSLKCEETIGDLQKQFEELSQKYHSLTTDKKDYPLVINVKRYSREKEIKLSAILEKQLEKISVDDKDKMILMELQKDLNHTNDLNNVLSNSTSYCPFCYQVIEGNYKETLLKIIKSVLNSDVDEHIKELDEVKIKNYSFDVTPFETLNRDQCSLINKQLEVVNRIISLYNERIEEKKKSIYASLKIEMLNLTQEVNILYELIQRLFDLRAEYYSSFSEVDSIKERLIILNKKIARKNYESKFDTYYQLKAKCEVEEADLLILNKQIDEFQGAIEKLEAEKRNVEVSVDYMNSALEYIFFAKNRMEIEIDSGRYIIKSKGNDVKPVYVSCGERNIIALCYFFSKMMEGLKENELYTRESLVIIDDPVSSFDYDNRIGIISYLKQQTSKILRHNPNSRIIFFSHDLYTVDSIYKFVGEIRDQLAIDKKETPKIGSYCYLCNFNNLELVPEDVEKRMHVYSKILKSVYDFASGKDIDKYEFSIGNLMRRLLEAFGSFEYQKGIVDISFDPRLQEKIPEEKRQFFESLMYRLVLHEESHAEDHISSSDVDFYIHNTTDEKIKTARYILCLIYALNPLHLQMRFSQKEMKDCEDAFENIGKWYDEIALK